MEPVPDGVFVRMLEDDAFLQTFGCSCSCCFSEGDFFVRSLPRFTEEKKPAHKSERQKEIVCVCVRARVCARACACACGCMRGGWVEKERQGEKHKNAW